MSPALPPLNIFDPAFIQNPYHFHDQYRAQGPLFYSESPHLNFWYIMGYKEVQAALKELRFRNGAGGLSAFQIMPPERREKYREIEEMMSKWMLVLDGTVHARMRKLLSVGFTPSKINLLKERIETLTDQLLDNLERESHEKGQVDFLQHFSFRLPAIITTQMLGFPIEDVDRLVSYSNKLASIIGFGQLTEEFMAELMEEHSVMQPYMLEHLHRLREKPGEDVLSALVTARVDDDFLSDVELMATTTLAFVGGLETTKDLLGNGLHMLLKNPDQFQLLREDTGLVKLAVEEMLRYESSIHFLGRVTLEPFEFAGREIGANQLAFLMLGGANRDPDQFPNPHTFDITRKPNKHLAFGLASHFCLGAPLARLEGGIAFRKIAERFTNIQLLEEQVTWKPTPIFRGIQRLNIKL